MLALAFLNLIQTLSGTKFFLMISGKALDFKSLFCF